MDICRFFNKPTSKSVEFSNSEASTINSTASTDTAIEAASENNEAGLGSSSAATVSRELPAQVQPAASGSGYADLGEKAIGPKQPILLSLSA